MKVTPLSLPDVLLIEPTVYEDHRGSFAELFNRERFERAGLPSDFVQDNISRSRLGVIRGLHYQLAQPQGKLIGAIGGRVFDVAVDIRRGSPTFGHHASTLLEAGDGRLLYVPAGFAHGFAALSDEATVLYKCSDFYAPDDQFGVAYDDPALGISWPVETPILAERDTLWPRLQEAKTPAFTSNETP